MAKVTPSKSQLTGHAWNAHNVPPEHNDTWKEPSPHPQEDTPQDHPHDPPQVPPQGTTWNASSEQDHATASGGGDTTTETQPGNEWNGWGSTSSDPGPSDGHVQRGRGKPWRGDPGRGRGRGRGGGWEGDAWRGRGRGRGRGGNGGGWEGDAGRGRGRGGSGGRGRGGGWRGSHTSPERRSEQQSVPPYGKNREKGFGWNKHDMLQPPRFRDTAHTVRGPQIDAQILANVVELGTARVDTPLCASMLEEVTMAAKESEAAAQRNGHVPETPKTDPRTWREGRPPGSGRLPLLASASAHSTLQLIHIREASTFKMQPILPNRSVQQLSEIASAAWYSQSESQSMRDSVAVNAVLQHEETRMTMVSLERDDVLVRMLHDKEVTCGFALARPHHFMTDYPDSPTFTFGMMQYTTHAVQLAWAWVRQHRMYANVPVEVPIPPIEVLEFAYQRVWLFKETPEARMMLYRLNKAAEILATAKRNCGVPFDHTNTELVMHIRNAFHDVDDATLFGDPKYTQKVSFAQCEMELRVLLYFRLYARHRPLPTPEEAGIPGKGTTLQTIMRNMYV